MKRIILISVLVLFTFSVSKAQSFAVGPQVGYYKVKDAEKGSFLYGGAARLNFLMFGVEAAIHYGEEKYYDDLIKVQKYPVSVSALYYPLPFVYACGGLDWLNYKTTVNITGGGSETDQELGYHFGAGVQLSLGNVMLTGDIKYVFLGKMKVPSQDEIDNSFYILSAGLLFIL